MKSNLNGIAPGFDSADEGQMHWTRPVLVAFVIIMAACLPWIRQAVVGNILAYIGDLLVVCGLVVAWGVYTTQKRDSEIERMRTSRAHLVGVRDVLTQRYDHFFSTDYSGTLAEERAQKDYDHIVSRRDYFQNFCVPTEPLVSLIQPAGLTWPYDEKTVRTATVALSMVTVFNQLVQQQAAYNTQHSAEMLKATEEQLKRIALGAKKLSFHIHHLIGDGSWYVSLKDAVDTNIAALDAALALRDR